jgi:large subunit ribosomal protein L4
MKRQSLVAVLSEKVREDQLVVIDSLVLDELKTKEMVKVLDALVVGPSVLLVADDAEASVLRCVRNVPRVEMLPAALLNTVDLLKHRMVVMTLEAVRKAEELWGGPFVRRKSLVDSRSDGV